MDLFLRGWERWWHHDRRNTAVETLPIDNNHDGLLYKIVYCCFLRFFHSSMRKVPMIMMMISSSGSSASLPTRSHLGKFLLLMVLLGILNLQRMLGFSPIVSSVSIAWYGAPVASEWYDADSRRNHSLETATSNETRIHPPPLGSPECQVLISNRVGDFHYEILESVALQYPIDWKLHGNCQAAGHDPSIPIVVDYFLDFNYKRSQSSKAEEAWGWYNYFEEHLKGTIVQRHASHRRDTYSKRGGISHDDQRWIYFRRVVDATRKDSLSPDGWNSYDVTIEANCGFVGNWEVRLKREPNAHCVLHAKHPKRVKDLQRDSQICFLNPQHAPKCWFVPSDLPRFPPPPATLRPLRVCIGWKADSRLGEYRDTSLVAKALEQFRPDNLQVVVIGRGARIPKDFASITSNSNHNQNRSIADYVRVESTHKAFYEYQKTLSQCHALIPLVHPEGARSKDYFFGKLKLSGMISQTIGNGLPAVVHSAAAKIYRDLFTAPIFEYNTTEPVDAFLLAFQQMMEYFDGQQ